MTICFFIANFITTIYNKSLFFIRTSVRYASSLNDYQPTNRGSGSPAGALSSHVRGTMMLRKLHRISALLLAVFAIVHIINHLVGLAGLEAHIAFMHSFRAVYRYPLVEAMLLAAVTFQIFSGLLFVVRGWKHRRGFIPWLQAGSGAYLAFFFLNHVGAVLFGRSALLLDTNIYYAAAGLYVHPFQYFFAPYYFLAVLAFFTHSGCALYWQFPAKSRFARQLAVSLPVVLGFGVSLLIVLMLSGKFYPIEIPTEYKATFGARS
ncbi:hypothetical protein H8K47_17900 [Undibacterium sp. CY7W]|uniref:Uncharacterized protein n=1 Tax=Undibacterium rugosum TaxID=2762291 RepID=A0A923I3Y0_9BURK|nr:hypothetical protein [Undibacterium rugosum]MBC3937231.1 hypothetical protein [Undibacterium rugosum]